MTVHYCRAQRFFADFLIDFDMIAGSIFKLFFLPIRLLHKTFAVIANVVKQPSAVLLLSILAYSPFLY